MCAQMTASQEESTDPLRPVPVLVIYSVIEARERGETRDAVTDEETIETAHSIAGALRATGHAVTMAAICNEKDVREAVRGIDPSTTLVFNLCEAMGGISGYESIVPRLLDKLGFQYAGATATVRSIAFI